MPKVQMPHVSAATQALFQTMDCSNPVQVSASGSSSCVHCQGRGAKAMLVAIRIKGRDASTMPGRLKGGSIRIRTTLHAVPSQRSITHRPGWRARSLRESRRRGRRKVDRP